LAVKAAAQNNMNPIETGGRFSATFCDRIPLVIETSLGISVSDSDDRLSLDFRSGCGVICLGHSHPIIIDALIAQSTKNKQTPNADFAYSLARATALLELSNMLPKNIDKSYFVNNGAQAIDAAIKLARKIYGGNKVISTSNLFHGSIFNTPPASIDKRIVFSICLLQTILFLLNLAISTRLTRQPQQLY